MLATALGLAAGILALVQYAPYITDVLRGKTRPHAFSWFVWSLPAGIVFLAQVVAGGGAGTWATGITTLLCVFVFLLALKWGEREVTFFDWLCLGGSLAAMAFWALTNQPLLAVVLATAADLLAFGPTIRKSILKPREETLSTYTISGIKWGFSVLALSTFNPTTIIYPLAMLIANWAFAAFLIQRRSSVSATDVIDIPTM